MFGTPMAGSASSAPGLAVDRRRVRATALVGGVIAAVVLGGIVLDAVIPAPSAGTQNVGGTITITAASGWILVPDSTSPGHGVVLQKGDATLSAEVLSSQFSGDSARMMAQVKQELGSLVAQISYGDEHQTRVSGNDTTYVLFEAIVSRSGPASGNGGTVDGEIVCMVVAGNAVVVEVDAPQGDLQYVTSDVTAMIQNVRAAQ
jgi:hypothetical protein